MPIRPAISSRVRDEVYARQKGRCALCAEQYPLHIHHIIPVSRGGTNDPDNLVLLCANHHALADLSILPAGLLKRYRDGSALVSEVPGDATALYELRATLIAQSLFEGMDPREFEAAGALVSRLRRARGPRYRKVCLELLDAMVASLALHDPSGRSAEADKLRKEFGSVRGEMDDHESAFSSARVEHHAGLLLHAEGSYSDALQRYQGAREALLKLDRRPDVVTELRTLEVHESSALHLDGASERGKGMAEEVLAEDGSDYAGGFAAIKVAEHHVVRGDTPAAIARYADALEAAEVRDRPLLRVMVLKGLATLYDQEGMETETVACATAALLVCQQHGLRYQADQLLSRLGPAGASAVSLAQYQGQRPILSSNQGDVDAP